MIISSSSCTNHFHDSISRWQIPPLLLLRILLGILWRLQTCQRHRESSPGFSHSLAYAPKHSKCPQGISKCLFSWAFLYTDVVLSHIRTEGQTAGQQANFSFLSNMPKTTIQHVSCIPKIWSQCLKVTQKCLISGEFQTLCLARYVYKKVSWKSFIINLWKQRLVFAFFLLLLPCWEWFVGVGQYLSCVKERDYSLTGKSCLQLTWCLFAFVVLKRRPKKRWWWCFFALLQKSMNDPLHEENLHLNNDFLSDKKKESGLAQKPI